MQKYQFLLLVLALQISQVKQQRAVCKYSGKASDIKIYLNNRTQGENYIQSMSLLQVIFGSQFRLDNVMQNGSIISYSNTFSSFIFILVLFILLVIGMMVIYFLLLNKKFLKKYKLENTHQYNEREILIKKPVLKAIGISILVIVIAYLFQQNINNLNNNYELSKCIAIQTADQFLTGYTNDQISLYKKSWLGINNMQSQLNNLNLNLSSTSIQNSLSQFFIGSSTWLTQYLFNIPNDVQIIYMYNQALTVINPQYIPPGVTNIPSTVQPILISNLGDVNRPDTFSYNILQEFNSTYYPLGLTINTLTYLSSFLSSNVLTKSATVLQQQNNVNSVSSAFQTQISRMHIFLLQIDNWVQYFYQVYNYQFIFLELLGFLIIIIMIICFVFKKVKLIGILKLIWILIQLTIIIGIFSIMFTGILANLSLEFCQHLDNISNDQIMYNSSNLFYNSTLKQQLQSCWFNNSNSNNGSFYPSNDYINLTYSLYLLNALTINISNVRLPSQTSMQYTQFINQISQTILNSSMAFTELSNEVDKNPNLQIQLLNSYTNINAFYNSQQQQSQVANCPVSVAYQDQYVYDVSQCMSGYTLLDLSSGTSNANLNINQQNCIVLNNLCSNMQSNSNTRYSQMSLCTGTVTPYTFGTTILSQTTNLITQLCNLKVSVSSKITTLQTSTNQLQIDYAQLMNTMNAFYPQINTTYYNSIQSLLKIINDPNTGLYTSANCNYLKYAFFSFQATFCDAFLVSFARMFFYLIIFEILLVYLTYLLFSVVCFVKDTKLVDLYYQDIDNGQIKKNKSDSEDEEEDEKIVQDDQNTKYNSDKKDNDIEMSQSLSKL